MVKWGKLFFNSSWIERLIDKGFFFSFFLFLFGLLIREVAVCRKENHLLGLFLALLCRWDKKTNIEEWLERRDVIPT